MIENFLAVTIRPIKRQPQPNITVINVNGRLMKELYGLPKNDAQSRKRDASARFLQKGPSFLLFFIGSTESAILNCVGPALPHRAHCCIPVTFASGKRPLLALILPLNNPGGIPRPVNGTWLTSLSSFRTAVRVELGSEVI